MSSQINHLLIGTWSWSVDKNFCFADAPMSHLFGLSATEGAQGQPINRFLKSIHVKDRKAVEAAIAKAVATGERFAEEYRVYNVAGETRTILATGQCFRGANGKPAIFPGHVLDVTECVARSAVLQHMEGLLRMALADASRARMPMLRYLLEMAYIELSSTAGKEVLDPVSMH